MAVPIERQQQRSSLLRGWGSYLPHLVVKNDAVSAHLDVTAEWIERTTGIRSRHVAGDHEDVVAMSASASHRALACAGLTAADIDVILVASSTGPDVTPSVAHRLQGALGPSSASAFQINAGCAGFVHALVVADQLLNAKFAQRALVVGAEKQTPWIDWTDPATACLFGDGAAALVIESGTGGGGLLAHCLGADGSRADLMSAALPPGTRPPFLPPREHEPRPARFVMDGRSVARFAVETMGMVVDQLLTSAGRSLSDVALVIPHQANPRLIEMAARRNGMPMSKVFSNAAECGNTSAASVPLAMCEALDTGAMGPGDVVALLAFGSGLAWGGALLELPAADTIPADTRPERYTRD